MEISYLGHSSFRIKTKTIVIVTDPFDSLMVGMKFPPVDADVVTVSHSHEDHSRVDAVKGVRKVISGPGEYEISGVTVIGIPTYHDDQKGEKRGKNTVYIFEFEDIRLCHLGDLGHELNEKQVSEIGNINILLIPVGGEYTINPQVAASVVRSIEPQITIPMHYKQKGMNEEAFGLLKTVDEFLSEIGLPVERLPKLSIKYSDIGEDQKIIVLESK